MIRTMLLSTTRLLGLGLVLALATGSAQAADPLAPTGNAAQASKRPAGKPGSTKRDSAKSKRARGRSRTAKKQKATGGDGGHPIANDVQLVPFPSTAVAVRKALADNRRDQLSDAEKAARAPKQDDRWQTVLFSLRALDARGDVEACFWRVLAYYRLGEVTRARTIRQLCAFAPKEEASLDAEEALSGTLQPAAVMPDMLAAGEQPPPAVPNPAPYSGASPDRFEH
jgi:hypothetical protein